MNSFLKVSFSILLILFSFQLSHAQKNKWVEGKIITKSNETIKGCVKRPNLKPREQVEIKADCAKKKNLYFSKEIDMYTYAGLTYRSVFIPHKFKPYLLIEFQIQDNGFHYFLLALTEGKYDLYEFDLKQNQSKGEYILRDSNNRLITLNKKKLNKNSKKELKELRKFFQEDSEMLNFLAQTTLDYDSFLAKVKSLNEENF